MKRVFIFGYYGFGNLGDEATLDSIIQMIREVEKETTIDVLTYNSDATSSAYGVNAVSRNKYGSIVQAIKRSDVVISGGGTLLQDVTSHRSLIYYLSLILLAKWMGKEVVFFSNGFGPIHGNRWLTRYVCQKVDAIILRDEDSKHRMRTLGIHREIQVTTDVTLKMRSKEKQTFDKKVAISLRPWKVGHNFNDEMKAFINYLLDKQYSVDLIVMERHADEDILEKILVMYSEKTNLQIISSDNHYDILEAIGTSKIFIGMRLHAGIFSLINERPIIAMNYDPKVEALAKDFSQICLSLDTFSFKELRDSFEDVENNYEKYVTKIQHTLAEKRELLKHNYQVLYQKLNKN